MYLAKSWVSLLVLIAVVFACGCGGTPDVAATATDTRAGLDSVLVDLTPPDPGAAPSDTSSVEVAAPEVAAQPDASGEIAAADAQSKCPGAPACTCKENSDCDNAQCIETGNGKVCATPCIDKCDDGYKCALVNGNGSDSVTICVPKFIHLCEPCAKSKECQSLGTSDAACVKEGSQGNFCGNACAVDGDCSAGFGCQSVNSVEGAAVKQCVKAASSPEFKFGECSCNALAVAASAQTSCFVEHKNAKGELLGQCPGVRACGAGGLSACAAPALDAEICDGKDNDCDGLTDEATCDAGGQCAIGACDGQNGCQYVKLNNVPCDADKSACTENDQCKLGICIPGSGKDCNDGNPCTGDSCDAAVGCTVTVLDGKGCDADGDACTAGDVCVGKVCTSGKAVVCDDKSTCTKSSCDASTGKCVGKAVLDDLPCDDGTVCTLADKCKGGDCIGKVVNCNDDNQCTDDVCDAKLGCATIVLNGIACDDDNICTVGDLCKAGVCNKGAAKNCESGAACVAGACDLASGKCAYKNKLTGSPCDDGLACSQNDECAEGLCQGKSLSCDDGKACTDDSCDNATGCSHKANNSPCSDGDACTLSDSCVNSACISGPSKICEDNQLCTDDTCNKGNGDCVFAPAPMNGTPCNDNNVCTIGETCSGGACASNFTKDCNDNNVCTDDLCDKVKGCNPYFNTKACDDSNACTNNDICKFGDCEGGLVKCDDSNVCTNDACDPKKGCVFSNNSIVCDDNSLCTDKDLCKSGFCVGAVINCDDGNVCSDDSCDKAIGCVYASNVAPCPDADACTNGEVCKNFKCTVKAVVCDDANPCTTDSCDVNKGCQVKNIADNSDCGNGNKCLNGVCSLVSSSCNSLHKANPALPDGLYQIDPDGVGPLPQQQVYCDMTTSGGGWLVCYNHNITNIEEMDQSIPSYMGAQYGVPGILNEFGSDCRTLGHALQPTAIRFTNNNQNHWVQMNNPPDVAHEFFFAGNKAGGVSVNITTWNSGNTSYNRLICTHDCPSFGYNTGNINQIANGTNTGNCFEHNSKNSDSNHHWATWGKCDGSYVEGNVQGAGGPIPDQPRDGWARVMLR